MVRVASVTVICCIALACGNEHAPTDTSRVIGGGSGGDASPPVSASGVPDAPANAAWLPPPGPENCKMYDAPEVGTIGAGRCVRPIAAPTTNCYNACWYETGAPGPEQCPPSAAAEFGERCCFPGGCGFDFGEGCTSLPFTLMDDPALSACGEAGAVLETVFEGVFDQVLLRDNALIVERYNASTGTVTVVTKDGCLATDIYANTSVWQIAATQDTVYLVANDPDSGTQVLNAVSLSGMVERVDLGALFNGQTTHPDALGMDGSSVYVVTSFDGTNSLQGNAVVELPCCNMNPRVAALGLPLEAVGAPWGQILVSAGTLLAPYEHYVLDSATLSVLATVDLASGESALLFDTFQGTILPMAFENGRLYLTRGRAIVSMSHDDCAVTPIVDRPRAWRITALAVSSGDLFWAENYDDLIGSRLFLKRPSEAESQFAQSSGDVAWIGVDGTHVYWTIRQEPGPSQRIVRALRP